jgi:surface antigen
MAPTRRSALGAALAVLLLPAAGLASVQTNEKRDRSTAAAEATAESGGMRMISPGPFRLTCTRYGRRILDAHRVNELAIPPSTLAAALAFRSVEGHASFVLPLQDGAATCVLGQQPEYLNKAAAAIERTLDTGRGEAWRAPGASAHGRIVPLRTFTDTGGRPCREFRQSVTLAGRTDTGFVVACRGIGGIWEVIP